MQNASKSASAVLEQTETKADRPLSTSMWRGFKNKCPNCNETKLFEKLLTVKDKCEVCDEEYHHHRADDLPAYLNIFIVGHVVVGFALFMMRYKFLGVWETTFATAFLCVLVGVLLMRPLKGMVVGNQWSLRMHGFGEGNDEQKQ